MLPRKRPNPGIFARLSLLLLFFPVLLSAAARRPATSPSGDETVTWVENGEPVAPLPLMALNGQANFTIDQLARLSGAQIHWQPVTKQACLSNSQGLICFNWERSEVNKNGETLKQAYEIHLQDNHLLIPFAFVLSKEFSSFSQNEVHWDPHQKQLSFQPLINLRIPPVEKLADRYRLSIETPGSLPHYLIERSDQRIWIRFVRAVTSGSEFLEGDSVIREVRVMQRRRSADLVLKLGSDAISNDVYFDDGKKKIVIDVLYSDQIAKEGPALSASESRRDSGPVLTEYKSKSIPVLRAAPPDPSEMKITARPSNQKGIQTVVIDAGHGGMDSGAIGTRGTLEKDLNLEFAKALARQLEKDRRIHVIMTRDKDEFIPLSQRTEIANSARADLFIAIHCNSSLSSKGSGFEAYYLSLDSTDRAAESVARLENSVVALESQKGARSARLNELLASMAVQNFMNESSKFATLVCRNLKSRANIDKTAVKEADFYVLRGAQMPSVLIELEYLSNPVSELRLRSSRYRSQLVKGIVEGVLAYDRQVMKERESVLTEAQRTMTQTQR